jgi:hypothetical protein
MMTTTTTRRRVVVVAMDIETLGLMDATSTTAVVEVTCVCLYDAVHGSTALRFYGADLDAAERARRVATLVDALDAADALTGFNVLAFDLECLRRAFDLSLERMAAWCAKCIDPLVLLRLLTHTTSSLQAMLLLNGITEAKTASGAEAVQMALRGDWDTLLAYCAEDARLAHSLVCDREWLRLTPGLECRLLEGAPQLRPVFATTTPPPPPSLSLSALLPSIVEEEEANK